MSKIRTSELWAKGLHEVSPGKFAKVKAKGQTSSGKMDPLQPIDIYYTPENIPPLERLEIYGNVAQTQRVVHSIEVAPMGKPRMTRRDKWKKRPVVERYNAYKDVLRASVPFGFEFPQAGGIVVFFIPMPRSWSMKKRAKMDRKPHQQRADVDNLLKGVLDTFLKEDCGVWDIHVSKFWTDTGRILIYVPKQI